MERLLSMLLTWNAALFCLIPYRQLCIYPKVLEQQFFCFFLSKSFMFLTALIQFLIERIFFP